MAKSVGTSDRHGERAVGGYSRIVLQASESTTQDLAKVANEMELSKVKALQVAVQVLAHISDELGQGAELYLKKDGKRTRLWLPFFRRKDGANARAAKPGMTI